jgi:hypothetical protein
LLTPSDPYGCVGQEIEEKERKEEKGRKNEKKKNIKRKGKR